MRCRLDSISCVVGMSFLRMNSRIGLSCLDTSASLFHSLSVPSEPRGVAKRISVEVVISHCWRMSEGMSSSNVVGRSQWTQDSPHSAVVCPRQWQRRHLRVGRTGQQSRECSAEIPVKDRHVSQIIERKEVPYGTHSPQCPKRGSIFSEPS
jgi:hypothetical protein